jgi:hypothetical protein
MMGATTTVSKDQVVEQMLARGCVQPATARTPLPDLTPAERSGPAPTPQGGQGASVDGVEFIPRWCRRHGDKMTCAVAFKDTSVQSSRSQGIQAPRAQDIQAPRTRSGGDILIRANCNPPSRIVDNQGNQFSVTIQVADRVEKCDLFMQLAPQVPSNVMFVADGVPKDGTHMTVVISFIFNNKQGIAAVRDIPVAR